MVISYDTLEMVEEQWNKCFFDSMVVSVHEGLRAESGFENSTWEEALQKIMIKLSGRVIKDFLHNIKYFH